MEVNNWNIIVLKFLKELRLKYYGDSKVVILAIESGSQEMTFEDS